MARIFVLNGVNLRSLGQRRPKVYGEQTLKDMEQLLRSEFPGIEFEFRQTDHEGEFVASIQEPAHSSEGLIVNPGAWGPTTPSPSMTPWRLYLYRRSRCTSPTFTLEKRRGGTPR